MRFASLSHVVPLAFLALPLLLVAGCPMDAAQFSGTPPLTSGTYWVEYANGQLTAYELPEQRTDAGKWYAMPTDVPQWYTGPALYSVNPDGTWTRITTDPNLTLDDILVVYDPKPPAAPLVR
jgi:hypothetical protein